MRLKTGTMVLVHPICGNREKAFVPCSYGYATTIRRAQGMSLSKGCVYFDMNFPPERGYAYVAVSRFRTRAGVYHYGRYRRSDWLPVGTEDKEDEQTKRSYASMSSDSDDDGSEGMFDEDNDDSVKEDSDDNESRCMFDEENDDEESETNMFDNDDPMFDQDKADDESERENTFDNYDPKSDDGNDDVTNCLMRILWHNNAT